MLVYLIVVAVFMSLGETCMFFKTFLDAFNTFSVSPIFLMSPSS